MSRPQSQLTPAEQARAAQLRKEWELQLLAPIRRSCSLSPRSTSRCLIELAATRPSRAPTAVS